MKVKLILPALIEAKSPYWRPIKYSLFPPLGLATLAGHLSLDDEIELVDEHVEEINLNDSPDLVIIQVYITNAYRAYALADYYRARGAILGGLHVTSLPHETAAHEDSIFIGPGEDTFPAFLEEFRRGHPAPAYFSTERDLVGIPRVRRELIKRDLYLAPNSNNWAYKNFYSWRNIALSSSYHLDHPSHAMKQFAYSAGWKKFEPVWNANIKAKRVSKMMTVLESVLSTLQCDRSVSNHVSEPEGVVNHVR